MFTEARKIHLLEEILKTNNEHTLIELEAILQKNADTKKKKNSIYDFVGILTKKEADMMKKAIEETCEKVYPDDWE